MSQDLEKLQQCLDYRFRNDDLLVEALTHRSVQGRNNERLEFLGDSALNFVVADELFHRCPHETEGTLSRLRASLVNRTSLAELARDLRLGDYLRLGSGEIKSGGHRRESILADSLEALLGAVYLDNGFDACRALIRALYRERLEQLPSAAELKDAKTRLQEYLQGQRRPLPVYEVLEVSGKAHDQLFRVECAVAGAELKAEGEASSRRQAEQLAAEAMLALLQSRRSKRT
ncbi:MAG TPA: ribonuclease III [Gammaproteobacteria bacterium]|nr:ribonuclease III [Gammaproteobacteria bacterium]